MKCFRQVILVFLQVLLFSTSTFVFAKGDHSIQIKGSDTMVNLGQAWAEAFMNENPSGDGLMSALKLCGVLMEKQKPLSALAGKITMFPQVIINVVVENKEQWVDVPEIKKCIAAVESKLKKKGRVLVRPSGTEPKLRIMLEGEDKERITQLGLQIKEAVERHLK